MSDSISTTVILKHCGYAVATIGGALTSIGVDPVAAKALGALMIFDILTGMTKAVIVYGKKEFKSMKLIAGVVTKLLIWSVPLVFATAAKGSGHDLSWIISASFSALIFGETVSILGNINSIAKKKETAEFDAMSLIYGIFKGFIERYFQAIKNK